MEKVGSSQAAKDGDELVALGWKFPEIGRECRRLIDAGVQVFEIDRTFTDPAIGRVATYKLGEQYLALLATGRMRASHVEKLVHAGSLSLSTTAGV